MYKQVKAFSKTKAGTRKNFCLQNVRLGFEAPPRYVTAWEAWQATEQHRTSPPPNLDVPVYFSYSATIDGVYKNWGHIGVRLKNGTFWSDGVIYSSIKAYTDRYAPNYVGWGESVNGFKVLKKGEDMYKGKDAKYWYTRYMKYRGYTKSWRIRYQNLYKRVKESIGKYLGR